MTHRWDWPQAPCKRAETPASCPWPMWPRAAIDRARACALAATAALVLVAADGAPAKKNQHQTDFQRLDAYLQRLGLFELQVRNLERELEKHGADEEATAEHLAEVMANRRLNTTDE